MATRGAGEQRGKQNDSFDWKIKQNELQDTYKDLHTGWKSSNLPQKLEGPFVDRSYAKVNVCLVSINFHCHNNDETKLELVRINSGIFCD